MFQKRFTTSQISFFIGLLIMSHSLTLWAQTDDDAYQTFITENAWVVEKSGGMTSEKEKAFTWLDDHQQLGSDIAAYIWHHPELGLGEHKSSAILQDFLKKSGFKIESGVAGMETGFVAVWGEGKPVIGFNAEFDALPGISQEAGLAEKKSIVEGAPGHGCGHNVFGAYSAMAAVSIKETMKARHISGTVKVYGTPAEETLIGKAFFVKHGIYDDADAVISWHPGAKNQVIYKSSLGLESFKVSFKGIASHASATPWEGRSALDAVELMSVGMNYMREHIEPESRIMSCITNGGQAPNVVVPNAEVWYYVRHPHYKTVLELMDWTKDIAQAAALMSQTEMTFTRISAAWEYLPNNILARIGDANIKLVGAPAWDDKDQQTGEPFSNTKGETEGPFYADETEHPDLDKPFTWAKRGGSIDEANTSWVVPMVRFSTAAKSKGVPGHSWQQVAEMCLPQAFKGGLVVAKYMAATALDLYLNPDLLQTAQKEHQMNVETYGPFVDPVKDLSAPDFELVHSVKESHVPKQWEKMPYSYPESLKKYNNK